MKNVVGGWTTAALLVALTTNGAFAQEADEEPTTETDEEQAPADAPGESPGGEQTPADGAAPDEPADEAAPAAPAEGEESPAPSAPAEEVAPTATAGAADTPETPGPDDDADGLSDEDKLLLQMAQQQVDDGQAEVIVVTGSAVKRKDLTTPAPVSIITKEYIDASGLVSVGDVLQNLPSQANAINIQANNGGSGATRVSLRGLGSGRTLVLVNGRRHVPGGTGANSAVDLNAIPQAVIKRVEVLKDGASAIYGSDAIGGVVNIITETEYDGTEANLFTGTSTGGGGFTYDISFLGGVSADKGSIVFSAGYLEVDAVSTSQRDFSNFDKSFDWQTGEVSSNGSTAVPQGYITDRLGAPGNAAWQDIVENNETGTYFNDPTTGWRDFNLNGTRDTGEGDLYNYQPFNHLITPSRRYSAYSAGRYKLVEKRLETFFELTYMNRVSNQQLAPTPLFTITEGLTYSADNVYNPFDRDFIDVRRRIVEAGNRIFRQEATTFRVVGGIEGTVAEDTPLFGDWRWQLSYNFGRTESANTNQGRFIKSRVAQAIGPSFIDADGNPRCGTPEAPGPADCVPLDLLGGVGSVTPEMLDYIGYTGTARGFNSQKIVEGTAAGKIGELPGGGPISLALGAVYRDEEGAFIPDPVTASGDTTGNKQEPTRGGYALGAAFAELVTIPIQDEVWAKSIELQGAIRAFSFESFGSDFTWKAGGLWNIAGGASLRGTYSTAFRAPSIGELYAGTASSFPLVSDPCDTSQGPRDPTVDANCRADGVPDDYVDERTQIQTQVGGNADLEPETADVWTIGAVWQVPFVKGLSATVDYWNVDIENAIQAIGPSVILSNCYAQPERSNCDKIIRNDDGFITEIVDTATNIGGVETSGVDFALSYNRNTAGLGRFFYTLEGTYLIELNDIQPSRTIEGVGVYDLGVNPRLKFNTSLFWNLDEYGAGTNVRYIHGFRECEANDCSGDNPWRNVDANVTTDLFLTYTKASPVGTSKLSLGVNNLLDEKPAVIYNGFLATSDASTYDFLGRFVYLRFTQSY